MVAVSCLIELAARAFTNTRLVALILLAAFIHPVTSGPWCNEARPHEEVATTIDVPADDCCPSAAEKNTDDENTSDGEPCPCPYPCTTSCAGYLGRAVPQMSALLVHSPAPELAAAFRSPVVEPSAPDPRDILHVPRPVGC